MDNAKLNTTAPLRLIETDTGALCLLLFLSQIAQGFLGYLEHEREIRRVWSTQSNFIS